MASPLAMTGILGAIAGAGALVWFGFKKLFGGK